jgi:hypothetical protein
LLKEIELEDEPSRYFLKLAATVDMPSAGGGSTLVDIKKELKKYARFIFANKVAATDTRLDKEVKRVVAEKAKLVKDER